MTELKGTLMPVSFLSGKLVPQNEIGGNIYAPEVIHEKDYENLLNKPQINDVELVGNKSFNDLGFGDMTALDVLKKWNEIMKG